MPPYQIRDHLPSLPRHFMKRSSPQEDSDSHTQQANTGESNARMATYPNPLPLSELIPRAAASLPVQEKGPPPPTSPIRPRHLTTRSITEISPPAGEKSILHSRHHHRHPHIHKHHHRQSGVEFQPEGVTKSEGVSPAHSRDVSRRGSVFGGLDGRLEVVRAVREGEVREERQKGSLRAMELRNALLELNTLSNNTTRRLDNTYYSVLEKLSVLQNTIASMQELATMTRKLNEEFTQDSEEVVVDVNAQIEGFEGFGAQEVRVAALAERVQTGREKIKALGDRVDLVRMRVQGWEEAEARWKDKTRKRLKTMWILMAIIGGLFVAAMLVQQYMPTKVSVQEAKGLNKSGLLGRRLDLEGVGNETRETAHAGRVLQALREREKKVEDTRLKVFDEL